MNISRIQTTLQALFQDESRWAHPGQRVVFWYDPDQQFQDTFAELQLEDIEKLQLDDTPFPMVFVFDAVRRLPVGVPTVTIAPSYNAFVKSGHGS